MQQEEQSAGEERLYGECCYCSSECLCLQQEEQSVGEERSIRDYTELYKLFSEQLTTLLRLSLSSIERGSSVALSALADDITDCVHVLKEQIPSVYAQLVALSPPLSPPPASSPPQNITNNFATGMLLVSASIY